MTLSIEAGIIFVHVDPEWHKTNDIQTLKSLLEKEELHKRRFVKDLQVLADQ